MLFDPNDECQAATEPERYGAIVANMAYDDAYGPSTAAPVLKGLAAVAGHISGLAFDFHGTLPSELTPVALGRKIPSIRPTLSRTGGSVTWRVPYVVNGQDWAMRAEVRRADMVSSAMSDHAAKVRAAFPERPITNP